MIINSQYPLLNDKAWLEQQYLIYKRGTRGIAKLAGAKTPNSARQALIKFGIPLRSISDGLTCNREDDGFIFDEEVLNGCLLGDGWLRKHNRQSDVSYPYFSKGNIYYDHVQYVAQILFGSKWEDRITENYGISSQTGKPTHSFSIRGYSHKELLPVFDKWYPKSNKYVKLVPRDIQLTAKVLLHWFMDDGNSYKRKRKYHEQERCHKHSRRKTNQIIVVFCSESFSKEDQEFLAKKMYKNFGIKATVRKYTDGTGWRIYIPQSQANLFYETIGPCPVPSMQYKWK